MDVHQSTSPMYQGIHSGRSPDEIKIRIIMDSHATVSMRLPVDIGTQLTLGQFKALASLTQDHHKFYFKSQDSEFGTVKEEIVDEDSILPVSNGEIVVWVISHDLVQSTLFELEQANGLGSQHSDTDQVDHCVQKLAGNANGRLVSGVYYNPFSGNYVKVCLFLDSHRSLGLTLICHSDELNQTGGILVDRVQANSVASQQGHIVAGDRIVEVNGYDLRRLRTSEAITIFKQFVDSKGAINMVIQKSSSRIYDYRDGNDINQTTAPKQTTQPHSPSRSTLGFDPITELPAPIIDQPPPIPMTNRALPKVKSHRTACSLPRSMTPRSLYTSGNYDNTTSSCDFQYPLDSRSVYEPTTQSSLRQIGVALHCGKDDIHTIYATLKSDASSLDIKDRDWLKVVVRDAFLGSTLVKWLSRNVYGFCNRSEVKRYANQMLSLGLIRSPMSNSSFSEKCYYTLT